MTSMQQATIALMHPPKGWPKGEDNASSLVVHMRVNDLDLILPGDLEPPGTDALLNQVRPVPGGILMAPHHGSLSADPTPILHWARPSIVIVSGGANSLRPEVTNRIRAAGCDVWLTARDGAVRVQFPLGQPPQVQGYLQQPW